MEKIQFCRLLIKLNRLERLGYLNNVNWWMDLREIRNQVMHDYPDDYDAIFSHLTLLVTRSGELLLFWEALKNKMTTLEKSS